MSQHTKRVVILSLILACLLSLSASAAFAQGGSATKPPPSKPATTRAKTSKSSGRPPKRRIVRASRASDSNSTNDQRPAEANPKAVEIAYWDSIKGSANADDFRSYLNKYPDGEFVELARNRLSSLEREAAPKPSSASNRQFYFSQLTITIAYSPYRRTDAEKVAQRLRGYFANVKLFQYSDASLANKVLYQREGYDQNNLNFAKQIAESVSDLITLTPTPDSSIYKDFEFRIWIY